MKLTQRFGILFCLVLVPGLTLHAGKGGGPKPASTPVTSQILDIGADGAALHIRSDSGLSLMQTYRSEDGVVSRIQDLGEWELDARNSTRTLYVDLSPIASGYVPARLVTKCFLESETVIGTMRGAGSTIDCPLVLRFDHTSGEGTHDYRLHLNWDAPGTDNARVTCEATGQDDRCVSWRIEPAGIDGRSVGRLYRMEAERRKVVPVEVGDFPITFRFLVTNP